MPAELVPAAPLLEVVLPRLVNALAEQGELVLSSTTSTGSRAPRRARASPGSSTTCPRRVQLVLSTRADPALPLGALRAHGQLLELRADDLRFTAPEADEFLNGRLGLDLAAADVELLVARTEGWPAGIYLAALSLAGKADKPALVRAFDGTSAHVVDFLSSEVLGAYEPELQAFMLRTSVLERLCVPLCDAVLGQRRLGRRAGVAGALEPLPAPARRPAPLVPLPPSVRPAPAGRAGAPRARARAGPAPARVRVARRVRARPTRRSTTRSRRTRSREAGELIAETWVHYVNAGRTSSVLDWLLRFPEPSASTPTRGCCSSRRGSPRCAAARTTCAARWPRAAPARRAGRRARSRTASPRSSRASCVLQRGVRVGRRGGLRSRPARARPSSRDPTRRGGRWSPGRSAGATTATATSTLAERWLRGDGAARPAGRPVDRRHRRDRRPVADRGHARRPRRSSCAWRPQAVDAGARARACSTAREVGEVHTAHGVALAAHGPPRGGAARARAGRLPAPAVGTAARPRRRADRARGGERRRRRSRARRGALRRGGGAPGRLPRPGRAARAPGRRVGAPARPPARS